MDNIMREFVETLKTDLAKGDAGDASAYDFIAENYMSFSKSELADIIKELLYAVWHSKEFHDISHLDYEQILDAAAEELSYRYDLTED